MSGNSTSKKIEKREGIFGHVGNVPITSTNALTLFHGFQDHWDAYKIIKKNTKENDLVLLKYFLLGRVIELGFKILVRTSEGMSIVGIKNSFSHRLTSLSNYAISRKYIKISKRELSIITSFDQYYSKKKFEYEGAINMELPVYEYFEKIVKKIEDKITGLFQTTGIKKYI